MHVAKFHASGYAHLRVYCGIEVDRCDGLVFDEYWPFMGAQVSQVMGAGSDTATWGKNVAKVTWLSGVTGGRVIGAKHFQNNGIGSGIMSVTAAGIQGGFNATMLLLKIKKGKGMG
ncbi:hypothetical protein [Ferrovum sp.]|uniref:hypothetical protein n=1 Tax=Ferrovum sp. TaxID=2609467 RepID=UPI00262A82C3|nr:hypothetical protein [Ferrovum sp.]